MKKEDKTIKDLMGIFIILAILFALLVSVIVYVTVIDTDARQTLIKENVMKIDCEK